MDLQFSIQIKAKIYIFIFNGIIIIVKGKNPNFVHMKFSFKYFLFLISFLLFFGELSAFLILKKTQQNEALFFQKNDRQTSLVLWQEQQELKYNVIDPLLSWTHNPDLIQKQGYYYKTNCILLSNAKVSTDTFKIYISGGSTSDLMFDEKNWPIQLIKKYANQNQTVLIYVASVGGYHSGQEYLKLIRDIEIIQPDIHISYSGANEIHNTGYYTYYENRLLENLISSPSVGFLPNFRKIFKTRSTKVELYRGEEKGVFEFWKQNILLMHSIAEIYNYKFISIIQPVIYYGSNMENPEFDSSLYKEYKKDYDNFYPLAISFAEQTKFVHDFTTIFANDDNIVFKDDCHLMNEQDQAKIAHHIFTLISDTLKSNILEN